MYNITRLYAVLHNQGSNLSQNLRRLQTPLVFNNMTTAPTESCGIQRIIYHDIAKRTLEQRNRDIDAVIAQTQKFAKAMQELDHSTLPTPSPREIPTIFETSAVVFAAAAAIVAVVTFRNML